MHRARALLILVGAGCGASAELAAQSEWDQAEARIVRMEPSEFPELPSVVRAELERLGCRIPQAWGSAEPHNVVSGSFAAVGQTDWAALCSVGGSSSVVVVWGGERRCPSPVSPPTRDRTYLQFTGADGILFSRGIRDVRPDPRSWTFPEGLAPGAVQHDAISDAFLEKGSIAAYCRDGEWLRLTSGG